MYVTHRDNVSDMIWVPAHAMGRVIGKGGRVLEELGKENDCKLQFNRQNENENQETPLVITSLKGDKGDVEEVIKAVHAIVSYHHLENHKIHEHTM